MSDTDSTGKVDPEKAPGMPSSNRKPSGGSAAATSDGDKPVDSAKPVDAAKPVDGDRQGLKSPSPRATPAASAGSSTTESQPGAPAPSAATPRKPQIGDSRPAPVSSPSAGTGNQAAETGNQDQTRGDGSSGSEAPKKRRRRRGKGGGQSGGAQSGGDQQAGDQRNRAKPAGGQADDGQRSDGGRSDGGRSDGGQRSDGGRSDGGQRSGRETANRQGRGAAGGQGQPGGTQGGARRQGGGGQRRTPPEPVELDLSDEETVELDEKTLKKRGGKSRKGRAVGRYQMNVHVGSDSTQISILEGRALLEHYVSRPADDVNQIHGNIYVGRVENVLPGMEAAFIDIATPKNAVLYRGDVHYDPDDILESGESPRIEDVLKSKQLILCQVTKNPIAHKGARLTQEVSLAGRFVVLVPNSRTYGISKRLPDDERKRLRKLLDRIKPSEHGLIVRTAAAGVTVEEVERDIVRLLKQWSRIEELASKQDRPGLLYREPELAVRFIREEFNADYRAVILDDKDLYLDVTEYVEAVAPALADRIKFFDRSVESLSLFDRFHITEQLSKTLDRKVWLPSGGSLIIEATEALTVIDVNTGRNVGSSSLEETVFKNNLEAAGEIARQLRLRDIGGIIVIDFIDMEIKENRDQVVKRFREALSLDKTRTQVFNISELGLVEMTRKRIGEGLLETVAEVCEACDGRGRIIPRDFGH